MRGTGLSACGRDAWPGLNPRMRGHGGEEEYLHEKFRRAGGRVICHLAVQWLYLTFHSQGLLYPAREHLHEPLDAGHPGLAEKIFARAREEAVTSYAVFCLHPDATRARWARARTGFAAPGIDGLVEPVLLPPADDPAAARAAAVRSITVSARRRGLQRILILDDEQIPPPALIQPTGTDTPSTTAPTSTSSTRTRSDTTRARQPVVHARVSPTGTHRLQPRLDSDSGPRRPRPAPRRSRERRSSRRGCAVPGMLRCRATTEPPC